MGSGWAHGVSTQEWLVAGARGVSHLCHTLDEEAKCTLGNPIGGTKLGERVA